MSPTPPAAEVLTYTNSLLPYFYSPIAFAASCKFVGKPVVGPWLVGCTYPGNAIIQIEKSALYPYGKQVIELLISSEEPRLALADLAKKLQGERTHLQSLLAEDIESSRISDLFDFYETARSLIGTTIGLGFSVEQYLGSKSHAKPKEYATWSSQERLVWAEVLTLKSPDRRAKRIAEHLRQYAWISNDWSGASVLTESDFLYRHPGLAATQALPEYTLATVSSSEADLVDYFAALRDERMAYERIVVGLLERYLQSECERLGHHYADACMLSVEEFEIHKAQPLVRSEGNRLFEVSSQGVSDISPDRWFSEVQSAGTTLRGKTVHPGYIMGTARIVRSRRDFELVREGDIIVAAMTRPEYDFILGKCAGVVVSEGGAGSHAEEVGRRYGFPILKEVPFATAIFRSGDLVELDATHGIVRRIKINKSRPKDVRGSRLLS